MTGFGGGGGGIYRRHIPLWRFVHQQNLLQDLTSLRRNWPISIGLSGRHASVPEIVGFA